MVRICSSIWCIGMGRRWLKILHRLLYILNWYFWLKQWYCFKIILVPSKFRRTYTFSRRKFAHCSCNLMTTSLKYPHIEIIILKRYVQSIPYSIILSNMPCLIAIFRRRLMMPNVHNVSHPCSIILSNVPCLIVIFRRRIMMPNVLKRRKGPGSSLVLASSKFKLHDLVKWWLWVGDDA